MAKKDQPTAPVAVRVLTAVRIEGVDYAVNAHVQLPPHLVAPLEADGSIDSNPEAVAYLVSENVSLQVHAPAEAAAEPAAAPAAGGAG